MLTDIILYIMQKEKGSSASQDKKSIELVRLFFILYLIDWHAAVKDNRTITGIQWLIKQNWMSDSNEIEAAIADQNIFLVIIDPSICLSVKKRLVLLKDIQPKDLEQWQTTVIDRVLAVSNQRRLEELLTFTFSTYPFLAADSDKPFNMLEKAKIYKELREQQAKKN